MKRDFKDYDFDREKKLHKVVKTNNVVKHKKSIYDMLDEDELDDDELELYEEDTDTDTDTTSNT